jgi:2-polyprenyl-6-methoxyphenol hydroxylase-like FAD-dependent oxidoreductase
MQNEAPKCAKHKAFAMDSKPRILIVGAGIAGLTLAAGLERNGITPTIVEIADRLLARGLGLLLTTNVFLALRRIGLDKKIIDMGIVQEQQVQTDASETPTSYHDFRPFNLQYAPNIGITREGLVDGLLGGVRAQIRYSTTVVTLDQSSSGVTVEFSDGTCGQYDLVVAADGIKSTVRRLVYPEVEPAYRSFCAWRTVMACTNCGTELIIRITPGLVLGSFNVAPDLLYAFILAHYPAPPSLSREQHLERLKELAGKFHGEVPSLIRDQLDPTSVVFVPVYEVETTSYYRGHVVLIGDAAHAFPPQFAQGAAMAIEDAVVLSQSMAASANLGQALQSYESTRMLRVNKVRGAVRHRAILQGMEGPVSPEILKRHPPIFANAEAIYDALVEEFI